MVSSVCAHCSFIAHASAYVFCSGIQVCDAFLFVVSPASVQEDLCKIEVQQAKKCGKRIVPVIYQDLGPLVNDFMLKDEESVWFRLDVCA